jgi:hypothetical protein
VDRAARVILLDAKPNLSIPGLGLSTTYASLRVDFTDFLVFTLVHNFSEPCARSGHQAHLASHCFISKSKSSAVTTDAPQDFKDVCDIAWVINRLRQRNVAKMARTIDGVASASPTISISIGSAHSRIVHSLRLRLSSSVKELLVSDTSWRHRHPNYLFIT